MKLKRKTYSKYCGKVIDLNVENSHTYNVEGLAVHNSGGGSLVNYVLYITDMDPIRWGCKFERFLNPARCLDPETYVLLPSGESKQLKDIDVGDFVVGSDGNSHEVIDK